MSSVVIENFRHGLDRRRSNLTSVLGTLEDLKNAHINQGGEIEQRKSFVGIDITPTLASGVTATFGLQETATSIVIFGAQANADAAHWPPSGFTYQQLIRQPAADAAAGVCDTVKTPNYCFYCDGFDIGAAATAVIYSSVYNGKAFVLATMDDGTINAFYDGKVVNDINYFGRFLPGMTGIQAMYCQMVKMINGTPNYIADLKDDGSGLLVTGPNGRDFVIRLKVTGSLCNGRPNAKFSSSGAADIAGKVATGSFQIQDGYDRSSFNQVTSVKVGTTELLAAGVNYQTDANTTAAAVTAAINSNSTTSGYNATNVGNQIAVSANDTGTAANKLNIKVTVQGKIIIARCFLRFVGTPINLTELSIGNNNLIAGFSGASTAGETIMQFVSRLATHINTNTGSNGGYICIQRDAVLKIGNLVTQSNAAATSEDANPISSALPVQVSWTGNATIVDASNTSLDILQCAVTPPQIVLNSDSAYSFIRGQVNGNVPLSFSSINYLTGQVVGGVTPYSYQWIIDSQVDCSLAFENPNSLTTRVKDLANIPLPDTTANITARVRNRSAFVHLKVTDANGQTATSNSVSVSFSL